MTSKRKTLAPNLIVRAFTIGVSTCSPLKSGSRTGPEHGEFCRRATEGNKGMDRHQRERSPYCMELDLMRIVGIEAAIASASAPEADIQMHRPGEVRCFPGQAQETPSAGLE